MPFNIPFGIGRVNPTPLQKDYYNNSGVVYTNMSEVNTQIPQVLRYPGLTVNIAGEEYWYKNGITNADLIPKLVGGPGQDLGVDASQIAVGNESGNGSIIGDNRFLYSATNNTFSLLSGTLDPLLSVDGLARTFRTTGLDFFVTDNSGNGAIQVIGQTIKIGDIGGIDNGYIIETNSSGTTIGGTVTIPDLFVIPSGAVDGYVLTSNVNGLASWQPNSGGGGGSNLRFGIEDISATVDRSVNLTQKDFTLNNCRTAFISTITNTSNAGIDLILDSNPTGGTSGIKSFSGDGDLLANVEVVPGQSVNISQSSSTDASNISLLIGGGKLQLSQTAGFSLNSDFGIDGYALTSHGENSPPTWEPVAAGSNYWSINGSNNLYNNNIGTFVGINKTDPVVELDVNGSINSTAEILGQTLSISAQPGTDPTSLQIFDDGEVGFGFISKPANFVGATRYSFLDGNVNIGNNIADANLRVDGSLKFVTGSEGVGKVLTSDVDGNAEWQIPAPSTGVQTVTGSLVDNTDPQNPIINDTIFSKETFVSSGTSYNYTIPSGYVLDKIIIIPPSNCNPFVSFTAGSPGDIIPQDGLVTPSEGVLYVVNILALSSKGITISSIPVGTTITIVKMTI